MKSYSILKKSIFVLCLLPYFILSPCNASEKKVLKKFKSPKLAIAYSLFNTTIPTIAGMYLYQKNESGLWAVFYGVTIGPSIGNIYAKDYKRGFFGIGIRLFSELMIASSSIGKGIRLAGGDGSNYDSGMTHTQKVLTGVIIGSAIYNIVTAPKSAREFNMRQKNVYFFPEINIPKREVSLMACFSF